MAGRWTPRRIVAAATGALAVLTLAMPFFTVRIGPLAIGEVSGRAYWSWAANAGQGFGDALGNLVRLAGGVELAIWIVIGAYLLAGPLLIAYFGVRGVLAATVGTTDDPDGSALIAVAYGIVAWIGLAALGARTGLPVGLLEFADVGFWLGEAALIAGAVARRIAHD